jgi:hypothetical protein
LRTPCTAYCSLAPVCGQANGTSSGAPPGSGLCGTQTAADGAVIGSYPFGGAHRPGA